MNSELDRTYNPFDDPSNQGANREFETFLDDWYAAQEAEMAERQMADALYAQGEFEKLEREMGQF